MPPPAPPVFGKRNAARPAPAYTTPMPAVIASDPATVPAEAATLATARDHAAFFAAMRAEMESPRDGRPLVVPRSFKAAFLSGLVVGCALAGFDLTGKDGADRFNVVAGLLGVQVDTSMLLPAMILLGLFAGARVAATTVLVVHAALERAGWTSHTAYAACGALASVAFAALMLAVAGHPPAHGWAIELLAGSGAGLCYRVFAGSRRADATPV